SYAVEASFRSYPTGKGPAAHKRGGPAGRAAEALLAAASAPCGCSRCRRERPDLLAPPPGGTGRARGYTGGLPGAADALGSTSAPPGLGPHEYESRATRRGSVWRTW